MSDDAPRSGPWGSKGPAPGRPRRRATPLGLTLSLLGAVALGQVAALLIVALMRANHWW